MLVKNARTWHNSGVFIWIQKGIHQKMDDMNELFYQQPYVKEFDAVVTGCVQGKKGWEITLGRISGHAKYRNPSSLFFIFPAKPIHPLA